MSTDVPAYWHENLRESDGAAHREEAARHAELELAGLRRRCAELSTALAAARAAVVVRHDLITEQSRALAERDALLLEATERARQAEALTEEMLGSARWRVGGLLGRVGRAPLSLLRRAAGRA